MTPWFEPKLWGNEASYVMEAIRSEWISHGSFIERFEHEFAAVVDAKHCMTVSNGTTALHLALLALGIGPGDEVIIPGFTFAAPVNMTLAVGAKPVIVDVDSKTWCIDPQEIEKNITTRTKAIIPVHIYGNVAAMERIMDIAKSHQLFVIEDVAEAAFSKYQSKYAGTWGHIGCFSFQATKTLTMGEGGAIVTNNQAIFERAKLFRNHGMQPERRYWHEVIGHNFRLTNYQAAFGLAQLHARQEILQTKKMVYDTYKKNLQFCGEVCLQSFDNVVEPVVWAVAMKNNSTVHTQTLIHLLREHQIETRPGFVAFDKMPIYQDFVKPLPVSTTLSEQIISLPSSATLTEADIKRICQIYIEVINHALS